ncbi:hypothetical protein BABINDRAFT_159972 [Babjeviella inositovora NRRL Y-12698]|uniref:non-specific serine/threonine protein kinase n=1 Tax=Babjeviella inositovora NRRL Y-12698 TaxID=984486 RepID=A0A1E3QVW6_9ASCO|nr:uncharacterized protein BABINDRAFT_159972 [Babjeviella inositovora NRRL Y-12698]ODQ81724.1 hypothetical protein BABINDRAFT_159972 [Babjeviella inositovora NRRL Y-12698]
MSYPAPSMLNENSSDDSLGIVFDSYGNVAYSKELLVDDLELLPDPPLSPVPERLHISSRLSSMGSADHLVQTLPSTPTQRSPRPPYKAASSLHLNENEPLESSDEWVNRGAAEATRIQDGTASTIRRTVKDFAFGDSLGEGSYSTVVLATDKHSQKKYAVKTLDKRHIIKEKKVKYVNIEKNALNRLGQRDGIVHLFFTFQDEQSLYFVLEYAPHGELLGLVKKYGSLNEDVVRHFGAQMVDAIKYMHDQGIVHRDIKPENILLDDRMRITITDFGTAKMLEREGAKYPADCKATSFVGTAEYVSPELLNDKYTGKSADLWAFACIVFQMIAGKPPFKATNEYLTFQKIMKLQYAFTAGFPLVVRDLVKNLLRLKPQDRLTVRGIQNHYFFADIDWKDHDAVWNRPVPELGPYKVNPKSMMPIPELSKPKPRVYTRKSASTTPRIASGEFEDRPTTSRAPSAPLVVEERSGSPKIGTASSSKLGAGGSPGLVAAPLATGAAAAASVALSRKPADIIAKMPNKTLSDKLNEKPLASRQGLYRSKLEYIPGTNILRPQAMQIKHPSARRSTSNRSSLNSHVPAKAPEVPQMSALDLQWSDYFRSHDERVLKVSSVLMTQTTVDAFEKRYKGCLADSPLGYRAGSSSSSLLTQVVHGNVNGLRNMKNGLGLSGLVDADESEAILLNNAEEAPTSSTSDDSHKSASSRFKKMFLASHTAATPSVQQGTLEPRQRRMLLITTLGRALLLSTKYDAHHDSRHELRTELSLVHPSIRFKEVVADRKPSKAQNIGIFGIECYKTCFMFEVDKLDVSSCTTSLAKLRTMENERQVRIAISDDNPGGAGTATGHQAAMAAAHRAVSPDMLSLEDKPQGLLEPINITRETNTRKYTKSHARVPSGSGDLPQQGTLERMTSQRMRSHQSKHSGTKVDLTSGQLVNGLPAFSSSPLTSGKANYGLQAAELASSSLPHFHEAKRSSFTKDSIGTVLSGMNSRFRKR